MTVKWVYSDGGRKAAGFRGETNDCVYRAISIVTCRSYREVYASLESLREFEEPLGFTGRLSSARRGMRKTTYKAYLRRLGWIWTPTMRIGSGCHVHLRDGELPAGRLLVQVSKHLVAVIDGVIYDTHDCSRRGTRCVYGYWQQGA